MKMRNVITVALALAVPLSIAWAAKPGKVDPDKLPKVACSEFKFSEAFLQKYPKAPAACIEGREFKGERYAKFNAKVFLNGPDRTTVTLVNASGEDVTTFSFKPKPGSAVMVNGQKIKFTDLKKGEEISFWVPEKRMEAEAVPGPTADRWAVAPPTN
jgi:hypothetical protein